ncbi:lipocalin-like domain-containing protein [Streptomyces sp. NBC_00257]|uniref:lipocalin-like domain-containing protein n=1 Tax=Streptomyces TaxID=1883 RepID=UPI002256DE09|nr:MULTISPECIES: lipocalin-like domain-containing protein [unclassified Streptomyces]WSW08138.1 lipocalin-like domain-containing protein [Streptomyces sp. NBC_01005]WTB54044.1 lipocalin-like domain-containing protein [Streptomyces sp. NBC_00826]WTC97648.1 lipocalin-like domain-containing protein [Streptomyces sp. NBC_01650]WTH93066.1 lipocalin-like domain-containing protein [Streptomyces sp. NBC_00825]WTI01798.1 lipocalin-like domain-containing protein [Streptomyces sp. NBC_00822]
MNPADLIGVWTLDSFHDIDATGTRAEGPLGAAPRGTLIYTADGRVSVHMMRAPDADPVPGSNDYMGYTGTWRVTGSRVTHAIEITPRRPWVGTEQTRGARLEGDRLTLDGSVPVNGLEQRRVLEWRRTSAHGTTSH